jgi:uncharacterized membrane protein (DUF373 family)
MPATDPDDAPGGVGVLDRTLDLCENVLYAAVSLVLIAGALVMLGEAAYTLATESTDDAQKAVTETLDKLLLVFILVELLGAVRRTIQERKLVAEPFLIVGIIASIKEVVVIAVDAKEDFGKGAVFDDAMTAIGVTAGLLLALGLTAYLTRLKERAPEE